MSAGCQQLLQCKLLHDEVWYQVMLCCSAAVHQQAQLLASLSRTLLHCPCHHDAGQCCAAGSRIYVHSAIYDEFVERSVQAAKKR